MIETQIPPLSDRILVAYQYNHRILRRQEVSSRRPMPSLGELVNFDDTRYRVSEIEHNYINSPDLYDRWEGDERTQQYTIVYLKPCRINNEEVYIPDDKINFEGRDDGNKSLLIESRFNPLTTSSFFLSEDDRREDEVMNRQPSLTPLLELSENIFTMSLEVFRMLHKGGLPLTSQEIRLAYYSQSKTVTFILIAGIHRESEAEQRMINAAKSKGISNPWNSHLDAKKAWYKWWENREKAKGKTPSLMFLWYLICLDRQRLQDILYTPGGTSHLGIVFRGTTEEILDLYCAQLKYQESQDDRPILVSRLDIISQTYFPQFAEWIHAILSRGLVGIRVDKYKSIALLIASLVELKVKKEDLSDWQWNLMGKFIRTPRKVSRELLDAHETYPEPKGRWTGQKGQKSQCDKAVAIVRKILE